MTKHIPIASLDALNAPQIDRYIVEIGYRQPLTSLRAFETYPLDPEVAGSRSAVINLILSGEIEADNFTTIWHASTTEPLRDVTKEIAAEVLEQAVADVDDFGEPTYGGLTDFLEKHCQHVAEHAAETMGAA